MLSSINLIFSARFVEQGSNVWQYVFTFNLHSKDANRVKLEAIILNNLSKKGSSNFPFLLMLFVKMLQHAMFPSLI